MEVLELAAGMKRIGIAYGKEYTPEECELYYDFLKEYKLDTWKKAVNTYIKESKFPPKPADLIEMCERFKEQIKYEVLEFMKEKGYFKHPDEYEKATKWLELDNIPSWFREDLNEYYKMMNQVKLEHKETLLIG